MLIAAILRQCGAVADFVADGAAALRCLRSGRYDGMVLDLMLPRMNGFEVIRELKAIDPPMLAKTIVLTAAADRTLQHFDDAPLVRRIIRKPFDVAEFVAEVRSFV